MITVKQQNGYSKLVWRCPRCGGMKVLSFNTGGKYIVASFDPPLKIQCCGNSERFDFIAVTIEENDAVHILV